MDFSKLRIKEIKSVIVYSTTLKRWETKNRKDHIIGIKLKGIALHSFENQSFVMQTGCVYFLNQKDDYSVEVYEPGEAFSIHFTTYEDIDTDSFCFDIQSTRSVISILQKAEMAKVSGNDLALIALTYELCDILEKARTKPYSKSNRRISEAKAFIDCNFTSVDCLEAAVVSSKLGKRRFRDLFKQLYNITPSKYIAMKKIELAQSLLLAGGISVSEISERCGFSDVYYFSKVFKQICGKSPSTWK
jgi:AraC-like DNA-binding protein